MSRDHRRSNYNRDGDFRQYNKSRGSNSRRSQQREDKHSFNNDQDLDENILREISKLPEPNEMWEPNYHPGPPPPPSFNQDYVGIYDDFPPSLGSAPCPPDLMWPPQNPPGAPIMQTPAVTLPPNYTSPEEQIKKDAAIESEMRHQKAALSKQREEYLKKTNILKKELETLKDQRNELKGSDSKRSPSPDTKRFLKENTKLQLEIQNKLKTIYNVVDMLNSIIGGDARKSQEPDQSPERESKRKSRSPGRFNYIYYDSEMHWCRICNVFPSTAKEYLNHLHTSAHHKTAAAHVEAPWHSIPGLNEGFPSHPSAPNKRTPIRGLQFFVPSTAWYCKLCDQFIGDLHCASAHLKSIIHSKNYSNFVEQNPHWETDWMSDRQKAFEKYHTKSKADDKANYSAHTITFCKDGFHTKKKEDSPQPADAKRKKEKKKNKKRKKSSSSSSESQSESSDSEPAKKKKHKRKKYDEDEKLKAWMSVQLDKLSGHDRKILDSLKNTIKGGRESESKRDPRTEDMRRESRDRSQWHRDQERKEERKEERHRERDSREERDGKDCRDSRNNKANSSPSKLKSEDSTEKKPEVKKMPFIGKMPVFKSLSKNKVEDKKKEAEKKKDDTVTDKKKREIMDAEIQKKAETEVPKKPLSLTQTAQLCNRKVAEFREKISKSQLERMSSGPELLAPPPHLQVHIPPPPVVHPVRPAPPPNQLNLPQDFQEALDIIFPSVEAQKLKNQTESIFGPIPTSLPPGFLNLPPGFPHPLVMPPGANPPPLMMGFDPLNHFRPQLYDGHVPISNPAQQPLRKSNSQQKLQINPQQLTKPPPSIMKDSVKLSEKLNGKEDAKKKEELDELAMLGIDASDVGAGI